MSEPYQRLPRRGKNTSKNDYGSLFVIGGSVGYTGAPTLCARAAVRAGAGRVWVGGREVDTGIITQGEVIALVNYMSQILVELVKLANLIIIEMKTIAFCNMIPLP